MVGVVWAHVECINSTEPPQTAHIRPAYVAPVNVIMFGGQDSVVLQDETNREGQQFRGYLLDGCTCDKWLPLHLHLNIMIMSLLVL